MQNIDILHKIALIGTEAKIEKDYFIGSWFIHLYPDFKLTEKGLIVSNLTDATDYVVMHTLNFGKIKLHILDPKSSLLLAIRYGKKDELPSTIEVYRTLFELKEVLNNEVDKVPIDLTTRVELVTEVSSNSVNPGVPTTSDMDDWD